MFSAPAGGSSDVIICKTFFIASVPSVYGLKKFTNQVEFKLNHFPALKAYSILNKNRISSISCYELMLEIYKISLLI